MRILKGTHFQGYFKRAAEGTKAITYRHIKKNSKTKGYFLGHEGHHMGIISLQCLRLL